MLSVSRQSNAVSRDQASHFNKLSPDERRGIGEFLQPSELSHFAVTNRRNLNALDHCWKVYAHHPPEKVESYRRLLLDPSMRTIAYFAKDPAGQEFYSRFLSGFVCINPKDRTITLSSDRAGTHQHHWEFETELFPCDEDSAHYKKSIVFNLSDINAPVEGRNSLFPLLYASGLGCSPAIELLLAHPEVRVNQERASDKTTPLLMAVQYGHFDAVKLLLRRPDIDVNKADKRGITPLRAAIASGYDQMIDLLLARPDVDVNRRYIDGTILYLVAKEGYSEVVRKLLSRPDINCDVYFNGHRPLDIAMMHKHDEVVQIFREHMITKLSKSLWSIAIH